MCPTLSGVNRSRRAVGAQVTLATWLLLFLPSLSEAWSAADSRAPSLRVSEPGSTGGERVVLDDLRAGGFKRSYLLYVPPAVAARPEEPVPLVVALHGGLATARIFAKQTGLRELAHEKGFVVAFPNGLGFFSLLRHWNGGWCCAKAMRSELDDVGFVDVVVDDVADRVPVDREQLFVVGYSNGGMLAYRYATERAERVAALGIWASAIGERDDERVTWSLPDREHPVPALIAHGRADRRLPFEPSDESATPKRRQGAEVLGARDSATRWARENGCLDLAESQGVAEEVEEIWGTRWRYCASEPQERVDLLAIDDWGHDWPGPRSRLELTPGDPDSRFDLATEMWSFFQAVVRER